MLVSAFSSGYTVATPFWRRSQSAENVVPNEPSMRCLPKILMTEQRMAFDMAIYSIDLVKSAMARVRNGRAHDVQVSGGNPRRPQTRRGMYMDGLVAGEQRP